MRVRSILRRAIGVWLMADGVMTGLWFAGLADSLAARGAASVTAMVLRLCVGALSIVAGWLISQQRPQGRPLGVAAVTMIAFAGLVTALTGLLPTNLDPSFRAPVAIGVAVAALATAAFLRSE